MLCGRDEGSGVGVVVVMVWCGGDDGIELGAFVVVGCIGLWLVVEWFVSFIGQFMWISCFMSRSERLVLV